MRTRAGTDRSGAQDRGSPSGEQRDAGRLSVLDTIRHAGQIARIDISRATGFSPATVTAITAELLNAGLIEETVPTGKPADKPVTVRRGRPRVTLKLRGASQRIAGLKVAQAALTVMILDFEGNEIADHVHEMPALRFSAPDLAGQIGAALDGACARAGINPGDLTGIGIGLPGQVDVDQSFVHWSSSLRERNVDLGALVAAKMPCPVFLDNDANLVAKAEQLFGEGRNRDTFLVVTLEHGVGLGVVLGGQLFRGARGCGAEFGHAKVQLDGALCQCGQRGCLEAYVGNYALLREYNNTSGEAMLGDVTQLFEAARAGDALARTVLDRAGRVFAIGLANLINIFDPQMIIVAGPNATNHPICDAAVLEQVARLVVQVDAPDPAIRVRGWDHRMWAKGAAAYAMEQVAALSVRDLGRIESDADAV